MFLDFIDSLGSSRRRVHQNRINGEMECKVDIGIIFDDTGFTSGQDWTSMIKFVIRLAEFLKISDNGPHFGVTTYGKETARVIIKLNDYTDLTSLTNALKDIKRNVTFASSLWLGIDYTLTRLFTVAEGAREDVPKAIILVTSGRCDLCNVGEKNEHKMTRLANMIDQAGHKMFVLGVDATYDSIKQLFNIEQFVDRSNFFDVTDFDKLLDETLINNLTTVCDGMFFFVWQIKRCL